MSETLANAIVGFFGTDGGTLGNYLIIFGISLLPILELRGGLIAAYLLGLPLIPSMIVCYIGNMIPVPFILIFIKKILNFMGRFKIFEKLVNWVQHRGEKKADEMKKRQSKFEEWGLMAFVAIPLPGTGGWTGSLVAALLDMDNKKAFKVIAVGVAVAGIIVAALSYGLVDVIVGLFK
ncbi:MAG: small multi-drug export protein [Oscillospiraceae bacterium]|nr:small multi-drug export protein [Candidatus Limimonas coprohippi]MCQ2488284.1 small multi-drug export protein [Clostridia bacterium]